jgi:hypothetical protein
MAEDQHQIDRAARWLRSQSVPPRLAVPALRERFGLSALEACEAIAAARGLPVRRASDAA